MSVVFWLTLAPIAVLLFVTTAVCAVVAFSEYQYVWGSLLLGSALITLLFRIRLRAVGARARFLSGNSPLSLFHAPNGKSENALVKEVVESFRATGKRPDIVGCGWGYFIGRRVARGPFFTHRLVGRPDEQRPLLFLCGTTIKEVSEIILKEFDKTFWSTPTHQNISIGSWLSRSCHGNSGTAGKPSSWAAETVYVIDMETVKSASVGIQPLQYSSAKAMFDAAQGRYFLVAVEFAKERLADNIILQKRLVEVPIDRSVSFGLRSWLSDDAVLRVLFFGTARPFGLGVLYTQLRSVDTIVTRDVCGCFGKTKHVDPHCCSAPCMSMQLDTCSLVCGWYEKNKKAWRGITTLKNANAFSPSSLLDLLPIIPLAVLWTGLLNFEFIFTIRKSLTAGRRFQEQNVQSLCNAILQLFRGRGKMWGRCEIRMGSIDRGLVFLDCIAREGDAVRIIKTIKPHVHGSIVAMHDSKYNSEAINLDLAREGLTLKTPRVVFKGV